MINKDKKPEFDKLEFNRNCSVRKALDIIGTKWAILIFNELLKHQVLRFGQLRKVLGDINTRTLTQTLKQLEEADLIKRQQYSEIPPRVEYSLTVKGEELKQVLFQLQAWYEKWYSA